MRNVDPYDSHPSLPDRIKALESMPPGAEPEGEMAALSLLADAAAAEPRLVSAISKPGSPALHPVSWEKVGPDVLIPLWEARVGREAKLVAGQTVADIPRLIPPGQLGRGLASGPGRNDRRRACGCARQERLGPRIPPRRAGEATEGKRHARTVWDGSRACRWRVESGCVAIALHRPGHRGPPATVKL